MCSVAVGSLCKAAVAPLPGPPVVCHALQHSRITEYTNRYCLVEPAEQQLAASGVPTCTYLSCNDYGEGRAATVFLARLAWLACCGGSRLKLARFPGSCRVSQTRCHWRSERREGGVCPEHAHATHTSTCASSVITIGGGGALLPGRDRSKLPEL